MLPVRNINTFLDKQDIVQEENVIKDADKEELKRCDDCGCKFYLTCWQIFDNGISIHYAYCDW